jgi:hypothetical protein
VVWLTFHEVLTTISCRSLRRAPLRGERKARGRSAALPWTFVRSGASVHCGQRGADVQPHFSPRRSMDRRVTGRLADFPKSLAENHKTRFCGFDNGSARKARAQRNGPEAGRISLSRA